MEFSIESSHDTAKKYIDRFTWPVEKMKEAVEDFQLELIKGLRRHRDRPEAAFHTTDCNFMLLDTCALKIPTGSESGVFYGVDVGGTNCRVVRVHLRNGNVESTKQKGASLRHGETDFFDENVTATHLFEFIAKLTRDLYSESDDGACGVISVGLTFSFGIQQTSLEAARVLALAKEMRTGLATNDALLGCDPCAKLNQAFVDLGMNCKVVAVLNDTTGTLYAGTAVAPGVDSAKGVCSIGLILGTGMNCCYHEASAHKYGYKGSVINTECGGFSKKLPLTDVDFEVDFNSAIPKHQPFEKMSSGLYLGEILRLTVLRVFKTDAPRLAWCPNSMPTDICGKIFNCADIDVTKKSLEHVWKWDASEEECHIIQELIKQIFSRSAAVGAICVAGFVGRMVTAGNFKELHVGVDGSLYKLNKHYQVMLENHLHCLVDSSVSVVFHMVEDASGIGGAIVAACHTV